MSSGFVSAGMDEGLELPPRLLALIDSGVWPRTHNEAIRQNLSAIVPLARVHLFAPEERTLILDPPPFLTLAEEMGEIPHRFWSQFGALEEISPELTIIIADFGLGSDTVVALDYRADRDNPSVIRLLWRKPGQRNTWVRCAETFDEFADMLGLKAARAL